MKLKRVLSLFVVVCLLSGLLTTLPVFAATTVVASGNCGGEGDGSNLKWTLDSDGTITISGQGKMKDWSYYSDTPWYSNHSSVKKITIGSGVTSIGKYAFSYCDSLTNITIPGGVTTIGEYAFYGCGLTDITIPDSVTSIGDRAFEYCDSLTNITIPDSVTSIGEGAFWNCTSLTEVTIPDSVTTIGDYAFSYCDGLTDIAIPNSVTFIGEAVFVECTNLTDITIPDSVTSIGDRAFQDCDSLTGITIPGSVTTIGDFAFAWCTSLTNIAIPDSVTSIGGWAFDGCASLTDITIPDGVTSIEYSAFCGCVSLTDIAIPDSVTFIGGEAFYNCDSLTDVYYGGSESEWKAIQINYANQPLTRAHIHYNSKMPKSVKSISLSKTSTKLHVGGPSETLTVNFTPADADNKTVNWSTTDAGVVKVNGGTLIPVAKGTATVTAATPNGKSASCRVTVLGADERYIADMQINSETESAATVSLSTVKVPEGSTVYLAACNSRGTLFNMTKAQVRNNAAQGTVTTTGASRIRAFIWDAETLRPITDPESMEL